MQQERFRCRWVICGIPGCCFCTIRRRHSIWNDPKDTHLRPPPSDVGEALPFSGKPVLRVNSDQQNLERIYVP